MKVTLLSELEQTANFCDELAALGVGRIVLDAGLRHLVGHSPHVGDVLVERGLDVGSDPLRGLRGSAQPRCGLHLRDRLPLLCVELVGVFPDPACGLLKRPGFLCQVSCHLQPPWGWSCWEPGTYPNASAKPKSARTCRGAQYWKCLT